MQTERGLRIDASLEKIRNFRIGFPLLFLLLAALNISSLTAPPFWDDLIGVQTQAVFLARHHLSFAELFASPRTAGSACYNPLSILCWFYALLYLFLPPVAVHTIGHLLNCACLAGCGGLLLELSKRRVAPATATAGVVFALTHPLLASRAAAMGQEALLAFFFMFALFLWSKHAKCGAVLCATASLTVKLTGAILLFGFAAEYLTTLRLKRKNAIAGMIGIGLASVLALGLYFIHFRGVGRHFTWKPDEIMSLMKNAYFLMAAELLFSLSIYRTALKKNFRKAIFSWNRIRVFVWTIVFFYAANFLSAQVALPRYGAVIVFPGVFLLLAALELFHRRETAALLILLSIFNLFCCFGIMLPEIPVGTEHDGSLLERSLEFTVLRDRYRLFCTEIEKSPPRKPLVTTWPLLQMLTVPEFGYVRTPVPNIVAGEYRHPLGSFREIDQETLRNGALVVFEPNCYNWKIPAGADIVFAASPERPTGDFLIYSLPSRSPRKKATTAGRKSGENKNEVPHRSTAPSRLEVLPERR